MDASTLMDEAAKVVALSGCGQVLATSTARAGREEMAEAGVHERASVALRHEQRHLIRDSLWRTGCLDS